MLVLSRKVGERITIGDDVQITITRVTGGRVTIGIDAPKEVAVRRNELIPRPPQESEMLDAACVLDQAGEPAGTTLAAVG